MGIRVRLLLLALGVALPLVGVGLAGILYMRTASRQQVDVSLQKQAELAAAAFETWIDGHREPLKTIAASAAERREQPPPKTAPGGTIARSQPSGEDGQQSASRAASIPSTEPVTRSDWKNFVTTRPSWLGLRVIKADGSREFSFPPGLEPVAPELAANLVAAVSRGWPGAVEMVFPAWSEQPVLVVAHPIEGGGAAVAYVDATAIREVFEDVDLPNDGVIAVFDPHHRIVYQSRPLGGSVGDNLSGTPLVTSLEANTSSVVEVASPLDRTRRVYGLARVGETGCIVSVGVPSASLYEPARQQLNRYLAFSLLGVVLATAAALIIARGIALPIRRLRFVAGRLGEGDLAARAPVKGAGEVAELGVAFNRMAESLEERDARLSELDRLKSEFVGSVSHELRTPLTTIKTLTRVLQRGGQSDVERREYLETIAAECDRQIDLVLNLLDLSRIEAGAFSLAPKRVDVGDIIRACINIEKHAAELRGHTLVMEIDPDLPEVLADRVALRRVLCSLMENAFKYTPDGGTITVSAGAIDEEIAIAVSDTGIGIPPYDLPHIFDKFYRGGRANITGEDGDAPETPGVGLGLYLAKTIVDHLGGRLEVKSTVHRGSTFTIHLRRWSEEETERETNVEAAAGR